MQSTAEDEAASYSSEVTTWPVRLHAWPNGPQSRAGVIGPVHKALPPTPRWHRQGSDRRRRNASESFPCSGAPIKASGEETWPGRCRNVIRPSAPSTVQESSNLAMAGVDLEKQGHAFRRRKKWADLI
ncbi:hypothetical protein MN608_01240 [Microdochium nivale]|nr:hypothetical protein MN608_01240 [Microdochium nivale]